MSNYKNEIEISLFFSKIAVFDAKIRVSYKVKLQEIQGEFVGVLA